MKIIQTITLILMIVIPILSVVLYFQILRNRQSDKENQELLQIRKKRQYEERIRNKVIKKKLDSVRLYLSQYGVDYMFGVVLPSQYYMIKIILTCIFTFIFINLFEVPISLLGIILGWFFIDIGIKLSNDGDNNAIMRDVKNLYDTLKIQTRAGVYLTNSLEECYKVVKNKRLKTALLELRREILVKSDIEAAVNALTIKFKNDYIDTFAMIISQSLRTGQSIKLLDDISKQMTDLEDSIRIKEQHSIDMRFTVCTLLLFAVILAICVIGIVDEIIVSVGNF